MAERRKDKMDERIEMWKLMYSFVERKQDNINEIYAFVDDIFCKNPSLIRSFTKPAHYNNIQDTFIMWLMNKFLINLEYSGQDRTLIRKNLAMQQRILSACQRHRPALLERIVRAYFKAIKELIAVADLAALSAKCHKRHTICITAFVGNVDCMSNIVDNFSFDELHIRPVNVEIMLEAWMAILLYAVNISSKLLPHLFESSIPFVLEVMTSVPTPVKYMCFSYLRLIATAFHSTHIKLSMGIYANAVLQSLYKVWHDMPANLEDNEEFLKTTAGLLATYEPNQCSFRQCFQMLQLIILRSPNTVLIASICNVLQQMFQMRKITYDFADNEIKWLLIAANLNVRLMRFLVYNEITIQRDWWPWWMERLQHPNTDISDYEEFFMSLHLIEYRRLSGLQRTSAAAHTDEHDFLAEIKTTLSTKRQYLREVELVQIVKNYISMAEASQHDDIQLLNLCRNVLAALATLSSSPCDVVLWQRVLYLIGRPLRVNLDTLEVHTLRELCEIFSTVCMPSDILPKAQNALCEIGQRILQCHNGPLRLLYVSYVQKFIAFGTLTCQQAIGEHLVYIISNIQQLQEEFDVMFPLILCSGVKVNCSTYLHIEYKADKSVLPNIVSHVNCSKCHKLEFNRIRPKIAQGLQYLVHSSTKQTQAEIDEMCALYVPIKTKLIDILLHAKSCPNLSNHLHELPIMPIDVLQIWLDGEQILNNDHLTNIIDLLLLQQEQLNRNYSIKLTKYLLERTHAAITNVNNLPLDQLKIQQLKILEFFRRHTKRNENLVLQYVIFKMCVMFLLSCGSLVSTDADICIMEMCTQYDRSTLQLFLMFKGDLLTLVIKITVVNYIEHGISLARSLKMFSKMLGFSCVQEFICRYQRLIMANLLPYCVKYPICKPMLMNIASVTRKTLDELLRGCFLQLYTHVKLSVESTLSHQCLQLVMKSTQSTFEDLINDNVQQTVSTFLVHFNRHLQFVMEAFKYILLMDERDNAPASSSSKSRTAVMDTYGNREGKFAEFISKRFLGILTYFETCLAEHTVEMSVKEEVLYSLGQILRTVGPEHVTHYRFKIIAMLTFVLSLRHEPKLQKICLKIWQIFLHIVNIDEVGPSINSIVAALAPMLNSETEKVNEILQYIVMNNDSILSRYMPDLYFIINMENLSPSVRECIERYTSFLRSNDKTIRDKLKFYLKQIVNENLHVRIYALQHLREFVANNRPMINNLMLREMQTDSLFKQLLDCVKDGCWHDATNLQLASALCLGEFGAIDPTFILFNYGCDDDEAAQACLRRLPLNVLTDEYAKNILRDLCQAYQFQKNTKFVDNISLAIQETLVICGINPFKNQKLQIWNEFPEQMRQIMSPLVKSHYTHTNRKFTDIPHPIFESNLALNYEDWAYIWSTRFIEFVECARVRYLFTSYKPSITRDRKILALIFPYMLLHALLDAKPEQANQIYEEFAAILNYVTSKNRDYLSKAKARPKEIKTLRDAPDLSFSDWMKSENIDDIARSSCQLCVEQLGFLQRWCYEWQRTRSSSHVGFTRIQNFLSRFDQLLLARASFNISEYPRALFHLENYIQNDRASRLQQQMSFFIEINGKLQDTDSIEGALYIKETKLCLEEAILVNRYIDRPQDAMMCYEQLINSNDNNHHDLCEQDFRGLVDCYLRMDVQSTARLLTDGMWQRLGNRFSDEVFKESHIKVLTLLGEWGDVEKLINDPVFHHATKTTWDIGFAKALLLFRQPQIAIGEFREQINQILSQVMLNMKSCSSSGQQQSLTMSYDELLKFHLLSEMEQTKKLTISIQNQPKLACAKLQEMFDDWDEHISVVRPMLRTVEPILAFRRQILECSKELIVPIVENGSSVRNLFNAEIAKFNLGSSRFYREANHLQQAHLSIMKAEQCAPPSLFIEKAKFLWMKNDHSNSFKLLEENLAEFPKASTVPDTKRILYAEAKLLQADYSAQAMNICSQKNIHYYREAITALKENEKSYVHLAQYAEKVYEALTKESQRTENTFKVLMDIMISYAQSLRYGHDDVYQSLPRMLTMWLDYTAQKECSKSAAQKLNELVSNCSTVLPTYVFFTTLSQLLARICHPSDDVFSVLRKILITLLERYPHQTLWMMLPIYKSSRQLRIKRAKLILTDKVLKTKIFDKFLHDFNRLTERLIELTNKHVENDAPQKLSQLVPQLRHIFADAQFSNILLPFEKFMQPYFPPSCPGISLPKTVIPAKSNNTTNTNNGTTIEPFPHPHVYIKGIEEEVVVLRSAARPKKIIIACSNGKKYAVMVKPKDDLRKDFRLMEFNGLVKRFMHLDAQARHRQLRIRTYAVIPFNDECGLVQWLPNLSSFRSICLSFYRVRSQGVSEQHLRQLCNRMPRESLQKKRDIFVNELLPKHPPVFHEWLRQGFHTPSNWYEARGAYIKTLAVMSMVGYILGLGDRHGENILFDETNGDAVHVDFNCLFNQGETFACPELVPFRLTQNMVHAMGPLMAEGSFRRCCEITLRVLREKSRILLSVLRPFVYDTASLTRNNAIEATDPKAVDNMRRIESRLKGYVKSSAAHCMPLSLEGQVNYLMLEATNIDNLASMYMGWGAYI